MTTPIGSDDAYPEQIATEFVRTTRNSEQEWKNRALAAELNLACEKGDAREVIGQLQKELDAAWAQYAALEKVWEHEHYCSKCRGHYYCHEQDALVRDWQLIEFNARQELKL